MFRKLLILIFCMFVTNAFAETCPEGEGWDEAEQYCMPCYNTEGYCKNGIFIYCPEDNYNYKNNGKIIVEGCYPDCAKGSISDKAYKAWEDINIDIEWNGLTNMNTAIVTLLNNKCWAFKCQPGERWEKDEDDLFQCVKDKKEEKSDNAKTFKYTMDYCIKDAVFEDEESEEAKQFITKMATFLSGKGHALNEDDYETDSEVDDDDYVTMIWFEDSEKRIEISFKCDQSKSPEQKLPTDPEARKRVENVIAAAKEVEMKDRQYKNLKVSHWKNAEGNFNYARLASDGIAGAVVGAAGGLITNKVVKKNQTKSGFKKVRCSIGGSHVADWGDDFAVTGNR